MTIEEIANKWAEEVDFECKGPAKHAYIDGYHAALTSLLEELPEVDKLPNNHNGVDIGVRLGAIDYRNEIKSLIKNKLK